MLAKVQKWGNSLALRIPAYIAREVAIEKDAEVDISLHDREIIVRPIRKKKYSLAELLSQVTPENIHAETDLGSPVGKEVW